MTAVQVHRIGEIDMARRVALRSLTTARYWLAEGDRRAAASALTIAHRERRHLAAAKAAHADCCAGHALPPNRPVTLPGGWQLTAVPGKIIRGRYLP